MRARLFLLLFVLSGVNASLLHANTIHVPGDSTTIQAGINGAVDGDTVMIAPGTYFEYNIDFLGKGITVMSTAPGDPSVVAATVVNGNAQGNVFYFHTAEESTSVLTGLTITGGGGTQLDDGSGVFCNDYASPKITGNVITGNVAAYKGGGIFCNDYSTAIISGNTITGNSASYYGGGIFCDPYSAVTISGNTIAGNSAAFWGGGIYANNYSTPTIANNTITGNSADIYAGGIYADNSSVPVIVNNIIAGNSATVDGWGGGIFLYRSDAIITGNTLTGNSAGGFGGGIYSGDYSDPIITNTILWGNSAPAGANLYTAISSTPVVTYSDIGGGWGGAGNIDADPLFEDGEYHLQPGSPAVDAGDPALLDACLPPGLAGDRSDMGAYGGEENCWWPEFGIDLIVYPSSPVAVPKGGTLSFTTFIMNNTANAVSGDSWLSALLPNSNEVVIPEGLLNYPNPVSGQLPPFGTVRMANELFIPTRADVGPYSLIGRVGAFPGTIIDEGSFGFQVTE